MEQAYQAYAQTVFQYLMSLTMNAELAEELTAETFYRAMKSVQRSGRRVSP